MVSDEILESLSTEPGPAEVIPAEPAQPAIPIEWNEGTLMSTVESILFAADRPVGLDRFRDVLSDNEGNGPTKEEISVALSGIKQRLLEAHFGFELRETHGGYQFTTKAANAPVVRKFLATKPFRLGRSALETLSIIAYRQPITRAEVDAIRGIDSSHLMRVLIERGMVRMVGKAEIPGRPVVYGTTDKFLETVGLPSLNDLPPLAELDQLAGDTEDPIKAMEKGLDTFIATTTAPEDELDPTEGLEEIEGMLQSAGDTDGEIYASPTHREVGEENKAALACFQTTITRRRKPVVEETASVEAATSEAPAEETPSGEPEIIAIVTETPDDGLPN